MNPGCARILEVEGLNVSAWSRNGLIPIVEDMSLQVSSGQTVAIVGESGCGKSVTAQAILRLLPSTTRMSARSMTVGGADILNASSRELRALRGRKLSIILQDPFGSLNPVMTVGQQIADVLVTHEGISWAAARRRSVELLDRVRIPEPQRRVDEYPHRMSGGMRQRVAIAVAVAANPIALIADEPTTALDVTVQAQILKLLLELQRENDMALVLITHDLGVVAEVADRVVVMYAGRKVEERDTIDLFDNPLHPYTRALIASRPSWTDRTADLVEIPGIVAQPGLRPSGCSFADRCPIAIGDCKTTVPELRGAHGASVACLRSGYPAEAPS